MINSIEYVYFIKEKESNEFIKIGKSINYNSKARLNELQNGNPRPLELICITYKYTEFQLHKKFEKYRKLGEWFYYSDEIKNFLNTIEPIRNVMEIIEKIRTAEIADKMNHHIDHEELKRRFEEIQQKALKTKEKQLKKMINNDKIRKMSKL